MMRSILVCHLEVSLLQILFRGICLKDSPLISIEVMKSNSVPEFTLYVHESSSMLFKNLVVCVFQN